MRERQSASGGRSACGSGARYEVCSFPGTSSGQPFVVLGVGDLCVFFDSDEAICELIDALAVAAQELVTATGRPAGALVGEPSRSARPARPGWICPELLVGGGSDWLSINETAAAVGVSRNTLHRWHNSGQGPPQSRIGGKSLYRRVDVLAWLGEPTNGVLKAVVAS